MWSHILEQYEGQDHTATSLREMISSAQSSLQTARPTMSSAESTASEAFEKLNQHEIMLEKAKELVENSQNTMNALEQYIREQEVLHGKIEKWHSALFGTAAGLIVLIAIVLAWLLR
jgi:CHASE3 domain sensor protein